MNQSEVAIVATGCVSCVGPSADLTWERIASGCSGIKNGRGEIPNSIDNEFELFADFPEHLREHRAAALVSKSLKEVIAKAGWEKEWLNEDTALVMATTGGQITLWENQVAPFLDSRIDAEVFSSALRFQSLGSIIEFIREQFSFAGPSYLVTSACSASGQAIALATRLIQTGEVQRCLVGGFETLSLLTVEGFKSLRLVSNETAKPFDVKRNGINLSEGASFLALEVSDEAPIKVLGYGLSSDAYHLTAPQPQGEGLVRSMTLALDHAQLRTQDVDFIHCHATGSMANDLAEGLAIRNLFGEDHPALSSTKWAHGHLLGGSGLIETLISVHSLKNQAFIPCLGLVNPDPQIPLNFEKRPSRLHTVLKTTLGFGGNNSSLLIGIRP